MPRRSRQTRLPTDDSDIQAAESQANLRVLKKAFLSASTLGSWSVCRVKPFVERIVSAAGIDSATPEMLAGTQAHEQIQSALADVGVVTELTMAEAIERKTFLYGHEYPLKDDRRMLRGIADLVFATRGVPYVLELKNANPPRHDDPRWGAPLWYEHGLQLQVYGLLAQTDFGRPPHLGLAYVKGVPKETILDQVRESRDAERALLDLYATSAQVEATPEAQGRVKGEVKAFRAAERGLVIPHPDHANPRRCVGCRVRHWCPRRLDKPGVYEAIPPERLDLSESAVGNRSNPKILRGTQGQVSF